MTDLDKRLHVILLTRSGCSLCERAHELLGRVAGDYPLSITVLDVDEQEGAALVARTGVVYTPGIVIEGDVVATGRISEQRLRKEIARRLGYPRLSESGMSGASPRWHHRGRALIGWLTRSW